MILLKFNKQRSYTPHQPKKGAKRTIPLDLIEETLSRKLDILRKELSEISTDIESRGALHKESVFEINGFVKDRRIQLEDFTRWCKGWDGQFQSKITQLEKEINELEKEKRLERVGFWRDKTRLREELRKLLREYETLVRRKEFLRRYLAKLSTTKGEFV